MKSQINTAAFSLVEVIMALGITGFCLISLMGLCVVGLKSVQESAEDINASNIATLLLAQRRVCPTNTSPVLPALLPVFNVTANNTNSPLYVDDSGMTASSVAAASYQVIYDIKTDPSKVTQVHLILASPAAAPLAKAKSRYDILTYVFLP